MVLDADPEHFETPWSYKFGDRYFYNAPGGKPRYLTDKEGRHILTKDGRKIKVIPDYTY